MSRIDELKKQYPELNISLFDLLNRMDTSKTYKYMPLLCKIFGERFDAMKQYGISEKTKMNSAKNDLINGLTQRGISSSDATVSELYAIYQFTEFYNTEMFSTVKEFIERMDKNQILNKDVTSYPTLESIRAAVSLAALKEFDKELESQAIKEYEDDKWLVVRPLTFQSSSKYGASTRWCTTYQKEKQYFARYWKRGILVYFINKETGYKFAGFKALDGDTELSFWNAADNRVDYMDVQADDYLFPIVKRILNSTKTNKDFCSEELAHSVLKECEYYELKAMEPQSLDAEQPMIDAEVTQRTLNYAVRDLDELVNTALGDLGELMVNEESTVMEQMSEGVPQRNWEYEEDIPTMRA